MAAGPVSPYAPGIVGDEPAPPLRLPEKPALLIAASFVMALIGPGLLGPPWKTVLGAIGVVGRHTPAFHVLAFAPAVLMLVWGLVSDRWPIMNARRESYLVIAALVAAGTWLAPVFIASRPLLVLDASVMVAAHSVSNAAIGGALVEIGRRLGVTSRLAAAWIGALAAADLAELAVTTTIGRGTGPLKVGLCTGLAAAVAIALLVLPRKVPASVSTPPAPPLLRRHLRTPAIWGWATVLVLGGAASLPDAAIRRGDWAPPVEALTFVAQVVGAGAYALVSRRLPLLRGVRLALISNLVVIILLGRAADQMGPVMTAGLLGLVDGFKFAALTDVTLRASPPGHEAFVFALLTAIFHVGWESRDVLRDVAGMHVSDVTTVVTVAAVAAIIVSGLRPASVEARHEAGPA